jgi:hypothetical protein
MREGKRGRKRERSLERRVNPKNHEKFERRVKADGGSIRNGRRLRFRTFWHATLHKKEI